MNTSTETQKPVAPASAQGDTKTASCDKDGKSFSLRPLRSIVRMKSLRPAVFVPKGNRFKSKK